ncbi:Nucleic acid-bindingOB-fold [Penicillium lividum]|nr:Nucleic acid-bindingOB-fold [Penicillium lividum]
MDSGYSKNYNPYGGVGGAGGAGGGGGFMAGGETNSPSGGKTGGDNKTLRPVTIKQINDATCPYPEAPFQIDFADVNNVLFIGRVRNVSKQSTNITYIVDDYSGRVEVKKWVDAAYMDIDETKGDIQNRVYVRVLGAIKSFGNKRYIAAHSIQPVTDVNQFYCSMLDATAAHLFFTRGPPGGGSAGSADGAAVQGGQDSNGQDRILAGVSPFARDMYNLLKAESSQDANGLHLQTIAAKLGLPAMDVGKAGDELLNAGLIFSTLDEHTWAILDY